MQKPSQEGLVRHPKTQGWFTPNPLARLWFEPLSAPCTCLPSCSLPFCKGRCGCDACLGVCTQIYFEMNEYDRSR